MIRTKITKVGEQAHEPAAPPTLDLTHIALVGAGLLIGGLIVAAFLLDLIGLPVRVWSVGLPVLALLALALYQFKGNRRLPATRNSQLATRNSVPSNNQQLTTNNSAATLAFLLITLSVLAYLFWLGKPNLLPVGTTVDAVHQYGLARYIHDAGKLPIHAAELRANLQDGLEYPPAFVTLVALLGGILPFNVVYLLYPVAAFCIALACGTTFALAYRLLQNRWGQFPLAILAAAFTLLPYGYTFGSITAQNYFAMALGEWLLLLALYFLLDWQNHPNWATAALFGLALAALLITYPTWALIPAAAFGLCAFFQNKLKWSLRFGYLLAVLLPFGLLTYFFLKDRLQVGLGTVANEGDVLLPDLSRYGWPILILALIGFIRFIPFSIVNLYAGLLAGEGLAFYVLKTSFDRGSFYSLYKLFYPATFLIALLAVLGLSLLVELTRPFFASFKLATRNSQLATSTALLIFAAVLALTWLTHPQPERAYPVITGDMVKVAEWTRQNLKIEQYSVGYSLPYGTPFYWVQIGFLGQPQGNRAKILLTSEPLTFEQWFYNAQSEKYFFTDNLSAVNLDERLDLLYQSGTTAILTRTPAYSEARNRRQSMTMRYKAELTEAEIKLTAEASFTVEPSQWTRLRLVVEPEKGGNPVFEQTTPAEPNRDRLEYMGVHFQIPSLKSLELYTNGIFPPVKNFEALRAGRYSTYIELLKYDNRVERRKLFDFGYDGSKISFDAAQRIQQGQFLFDGPLSPDANLPAIRQDFGPDLPQLAAVELKGEAKAGQNAQFSFSWFNPVSQSKNYRVVLAFVDSQGQVVSENELVPLNGLFPVWFWPNNQPVVYTQTLKMPDKPGSYRIDLTLLDPETKARSVLRMLDKILEVH